MNEINLTLTLEEVNSVLNALGTQPYAQVQPLIAKIQAQGSAQLQSSTKWAGRSSQSAKKGQQLKRKSHDQVIF